MNTTENTLTAAETVALNKVVGASEAQKASAGLTVGEHVVDFIVHVTGTLKRGEDFSQNIVAKADPWLMLAAALSHLNGVTVDSLVAESLTDDPALVKSLKKQAADALAAIKVPTLTPCNGKVTTKVAAARA